MFSCNNIFKEQSIIYFISYVVCLRVVRNLWPVVYLAYS